MGLKEILPSGIKMPSMDFSAVLGKAGVIVEAVLICGVMVGIIIFIRWFFSYKHQVEIIEMAGEGKDKRVVWCGRDKGKEIVTKNGLVFKLFKHRKELPMPFSEHKIPMGKNKYKVYMLKNSDDLYFMKPTTLFGEGQYKTVLEPTPSSVRHWGKLQLEQAAMEHIKPKWYMNPAFVTPIIFIIMVVAVMVMFKWVLARADVVTANIGGHADAIRYLADSVRNACMEQAKNIPSIPNYPAGASP